jgi:CRP-like cAMP-binding protein
MMKVSLGMYPDQTPEVLTTRKLAVAARQIRSERKYEMRVQPAVGGGATKTRAIEEHPFVVKLMAHGHLDSEDLKAVGRVLNRKVTVKKGQDIMVQGYEYKTLDIVESGFGLRFTLLHQGGRQILNAVLPGDLVGFPSSFFRPSIFSAMAATPMSLHRVSIEAFTELCRQRTNIAMALVWFAAREASIYAHHLVNAGRRSPLERVAHFLLETHFRLKAVGCASDRSFELPFSQESIGDTLGLSTPHVNRMLSELRHQGLIGTQNHTISILDRSALQILAEFEPSYLERTSFYRASKACGADDHPLCGIAR